MLYNRGVIVNAKVILNWGVDSVCEVRGHENRNSAEITIIALFTMRIQAVSRLVDSSSERYGRLLNWQNPPDPFWHYGIGLSDTYVYTGQGLCPFESINAKFVVGIDDIAFEPKQTIERLKQALHVFSNWEYIFAGWNCEHLSRLIETDRPRCY